MLQKEGAVFTGSGAPRCSSRGHRRRERGAPEGAGLGEEAQFDIPEEIQGNRKCVQERGFRAGRRE